MSASTRFLSPVLATVFAACSLLALADEPRPPEPELPAATEASTARETPAFDPAAVRTGNLLAPKAFRAAVERVMPSVVTIESFGGLSTAARGKMRGISRPGDGPTTGLVISPDGYVITSTFNFIRKPPIITVVRSDGTRHVAKMLGRDDTRKITVLKIEGVDDLPVPDFVADSEVRVGQWAITVGVGYGDREPLISSGIISAQRRISGRAVQTDANISPANYGGPLIDIAGRVIGICVPLSPQSQEVGAGVEWYDSGIGFAVPVAGNERIIAALKDGETVKAGVLGVQIKPAEENGSGAEVVKVLEKSGAAEAGIEEKDRIIQVAGEEILDVAHLRSIVGRYAAGDEVEVTVRRDGEEIELTVKLQEFVPPKKQPSPKINRKLEPKEKEEES